MQSKYSTAIARDEESVLVEKSTANPHILIGGSGVQRITKTAPATIENPIYDQILKRSFFDWYQASLVDVKVDSFLKVASNYFDCDVRHTKPDKPYEVGYELSRGEIKFLKVSHGGVNEGMFLKASGHNAPEFSDFLKKYYPIHSVSRVDSAIDFDDPEAFSILYEQAKHVAAKYRLKFNQLGDWRSESEREGGRTIQIGSRKSPVFIRIYEKGYEQLEKNSDENVSLDWVRLELELKPANKEAKRFISEATPRQVLSINEWVRELTAAMGDHDILPIKVGTAHRKSDLHRSYSHMVKQYGSTIEKIVSDTLEGDWSLLSEYIQNSISHSRKK